MGFDASFSLKISPLGTTVCSSSPGIVLEAIEAARTLRGIFVDRKDSKD